MRLFYLGPLRANALVRLRTTKAMKSLLLRHAASLLSVLSLVFAGALEARAQVFEQDVAGVEISPEGVLQVRRVDQGVGRQRWEAARQQLGAELAAKSELRKVSLNRLESAVAEAVSRGEQPDMAMQAMAGLTAVRYVFFYPESGDIVLAGPAEGFFEDGTGRLRGIDSGLPTLLLEDVVTALRAYPPGAKGVGQIRVSIDPTEEGLEQLQKAIRTAGNITRGAERRLAELLKNSLGLQTVTIEGVPATTHFAQVLVEADYRMKLIGIGLERLPIRFQSFVDRSAATSGSANAMERWYFQPDYECVMVSEDGLGMGLTGNAVRLVGASELVGAGGKRGERAGANRASEEFCKEFTERFDEIANAVPVYAQMRNLIDLSIAAAFIQQQDYATQAGWQMSVFMDETQMPVEKYAAPNQVETAVNAVWKGTTLLTPLGGGVTMVPRRALKPEVMRKDTAGELVKPRHDVAPGDLAAGQWWWD